MERHAPRFLTTDEVAQFDALGFVIRRGAFGSAEVAAAVRELEAVCADFLGHAPGGGDVVWKPRFVEGSRALTDLVADDRVYLAVCDLLGDDVLWSGSECMWSFDDSLADHDWHADGGWLPEQTAPFRLKVMLYLDPLRADTGALRVIPGSHRSLLHESLLPFNDASAPGGSRRYFGRSGADVPAPRHRDRSRRRGVLQQLAVSLGLRKGPAAPGDHSQVRLHASHRASPRRGAP